MCCQHLHCDHNHEKFLLVRDTIINILIVRLKMRKTGEGVKADQEDEQLEQVDRHLKLCWMVKKSNWVKFQGAVKGLMKISWCCGQCALYNVHVCFLCREKQFQSKNYFLAPPTDRPLVSPQQRLLCPIHEERAAKNVKKKGKPTMSEDTKSSRFCVWSEE